MLEEEETFYLRCAGDSVSVRISAIEQLVLIRPALLEFNKEPKIQKLEISKIPGKELDTSNRSFKLSKMSFPHLSLTGVPLNPFIYKHKNLTEFTYNGTFAQPIDRLLEFIDNNWTSLRRLNLEDIKFQPPEHRHPHVHPRVDRELLPRHLQIRSDDAEDIKALISHITLKSTKDSKITVTSGNPRIMTVICSAFNAKYFKDSPVSVSYRLGVGCIIPGVQSDSESKGPELTLKCVSLWKARRRVRPKSEEIISTNTHVGTSNNLFEV